MSISNNPIGLARIGQQYMESMGKRNLPDVPLPNPSQTQEPEREGSQASVEASAPREASAAWASKWLMFCRNFGIDPTTDGETVVARFDHAGELFEAYIKHIVKQEGTTHIFTMGPEFSDADKEHIKQIGGVS